MVLEFIGGAVLLMGLLGLLFFAIARIIHAAYRNEALRGTAFSQMYVDQSIISDKPSPPTWVLWISFATTMIGIILIVLRL